MVKASIILKTLASSEEESEQGEDGEEGPVEDGAFLRADLDAEGFLEGIAGSAGGTLGAGACGAVGNAGAAGFTGGQIVARVASSAQGGAATLTSGAVAGGALERAGDEHGYNGESKDLHF